MSLSETLVVTGSLLLIALGSFIAGCLSPRGAGGAL
jgi:heme A synthase